MDATSGLERMIAPALTAMGFALVRVRLSGSGRPVLQVMIEREDGATITVENCAEASRMISALLDVEDPIAGAFNLEVSSPGIDRPLTRLGDFDRFAGWEAKIELDRPVDGRKRFRGKLLGVAGDQVRLEQDGSQVEVPFATIVAAKLVLTNEMLARDLKQRREAART
jgi:ribosome maturation factor RimP